MKQFLNLIIFLSLAVTSFSALSQPIDNSNNTLMSLYVTEELSNNHKAKMREQLNNIQYIVEALALQDYDAALVACEQMQNHKNGGNGGKGNKIAMANPDFKPMAKAVHNSFDEMCEVIREKNIYKSLEALSFTMQNCNSCHETFKHKIISQEEFNSIINK